MYSLPPCKFDKIHSCNLSSFLFCSAIYIQFFSFSRFIPSMPHISRRTSTKKSRVRRPKIFSRSSLPFPAESKSLTSTPSASDNFEPRDITIALNQCIPWLNGRNTLSISGMFLFLKYFWIKWMEFLDRKELMVTFVIINCTLKWYLYLYMISIRQQIICDRAHNNNPQVNKIKIKLCG